jgi:hypothetical protein
MRRPLALAALLLWLATPPAAAATPRWHWPLRGELTGRFRVTPASPYAAGQHWGIDIAAAPGTPVGSACSGTVTFAGAVPRGGLGVTVRCGRLAATHLGLGAVAVRAGSRLAPGTRLGTLGREGRLRLGARVADRRFGYVDPLGLLAPDPVPRPPLGGAPRARPALPAPLHAPSRRPAPPVAPPAVPSLAWLGVGLLAAGVPLGGLTRRRTRRRRAAAAAARAARPSPSTGRM